MFKINKKKIEDLENQIFDYQEKVAILEMKLELVEGEKANPKSVVEGIFNRGLKWFDYQDLKPEDLQNYYDDAQRILSSKVFNNEYKHIIVDHLEAAVLEGLDSQALRDFQMTANGIELLKDRLEEIIVPNNTTKKK